VQHLRLVHPGDAELRGLHQVRCGEQQRSPHPLTGDLLRYCDSAGAQLPHPLLLLHPPSDPRGCPHLGDHDDVRLPNIPEVVEMQQIRLLSHPHDRNNRSVLRRRGWHHSRRSPQLADPAESVDPASRHHRNPNGTFCRLFSYQSRHFDCRTTKETTTFTSDRKWDSSTPPPII
jgi:hypothetical protein